MIDLPPELTPLFNELQKRMGRNLMFYQGMEAALKMLLPYMHSTDGNVPAVPGKNGKISTLGNLIQAYLDRLSIQFEFQVDDTHEMTKLFTTPIRKVVESRNRLAHTFFHTPGVDSYTRAGLETGLRILDEDYRDAEAVYDDLVPPIIIFLEIMSARSPQSDELALLHRALLAYAEQRGLSVIVHQKNFAEIIALLKEAEVIAPKVDGMTPLSFAGKFIRKSAPEFRPEQLGEKSLTAILVATDMFDVQYLPHQSGSGNTVHYCSRPWLGVTEYHIFLEK